MIMLHPDRYFDPSRRPVARELYESVRGLPLICPHGHVDPRLFSDPDYTFGSPVDLFIIPDHYIYRMLYAHGIALESLGIPTQDGTLTETDHRKIWQTFADHFYLFRGTPTGIWLVDEFERVFDIHEKLTSESAQRFYDQIAARLVEMKPRTLYEQFNIEVLCTTDAATDQLAHHRAVTESGWGGRILPTFRPDAVVNIDTEGWQKHIEALSEISGIAIHDYKRFIDALENRRTYLTADRCRITTDF
jgi:glucuronate isomerase